MKYFLVFLCSFCVLCQICIGGDDSSSQEEGSDNSLKDLQKNVSSLWTYVSGMRQKVEHDLHQLHQHQMEVSNKLKSMFGIELEHSDGHMHHMDQEQHPDDHNHEGHHHDDNHSHEYHDSHHDGHYDDHHHDEHSSEHQHGNDHHHHEDDHHDDHHSDHHDDHRGEDHHHGNHGHDDHHHHPSHDDHNQDHNDSAHSHTSDNHQHEHSTDDGHQTHTGHMDDHHTHAGHTDDHHTHAGHTDDHHTHAGHTDDHHAHAGHTDEGHDHSEDNDTNHSSESHHHQHHQESHQRSHHHHQEHEAHHHHRYSHYHSHHDQHAHSSKYEFAVCEVEPNTAIPPEKQQNVTGRINLWQQKNGTTLHIHIKVKGFKMDGHGDHGDQETGQDHHPTQHIHGFHVHQEGDLSNSCQSTGPHYNPAGVQHGGPSSAIRHVGDLGNIQCDQHGVTNVLLTDQIASLHGENSITGKSMVIHERNDDLGTNPDNPDSLSSGDAGTRIACCIIRRVERLSRGHSHGHHHH